MCASTRCIRVYVLFLLIIEGLVSHLLEGCVRVLFLFIIEGLVSHLLEGCVRVLFLFIIEGDLELMSHKQELK